MNRELIEEMLRALRSVSVTCENFHHPKVDQNHGFWKCGPHNRFLDAIKKAEEYLEATKSVSSPTKLVRELRSVPGTWRDSVDLCIEAADALDACYNKSTK